MSKILLGVTGGIAAYKSCSLARSLIKDGHEVKVLMTENAGRFVGKATFETLTGNQVYDSLWNDRISTTHISLADWSDLLIVAPASANIIGKYASGIADDILSTELLSFSGNVMVIPSMNDKMYAHPAVVSNIELLKSRGVHFLEPEMGFLACGTTGKGRMPKEDSIILKAYSLLEKRDCLRGRNVIVTAGALTEKFDPVRVITNLSSGRIGKYFAEAAYRFKADSVTLIHGRMECSVPGLIRTEEIQSAQDMKIALENAVQENDILIMSAAVSDFKPIYNENKIKRQDGFHPEYEQNPDIIASISRKGLLKIGFALETDKSEQNGLKKMEAKNLDYIIVNSPGNIGKINGTVTALSKSGRRLELKDLPKSVIAEKVLEWIEL